jgi:hypothetical protein
MKVIEIKNWCDQNLTPLAWQRIVMKNLDAFKANNLALSELNNPTPDIEISKEMVDAICVIIQDLYQVQVSQNTF